MEGAFRFAETGQALLCSRRINIKVKRIHRLHTLAKELKKNQHESRGGRKTDDIAEGAANNILATYRVICVGPQHRFL